MRIVAYFLSIVLFLYTTFSPVLAAENSDQQASSSGSLNVYELFWPVTAGKTLDDSFYFLKEFKEKIRAIFIFSATKKAEYEVALGTKRILEAEKLLKTGKNDLADKTLDLSLVQFSEAKKNLEMAKDKKESLKKSGTETLKKLSNLEKYLTNIIDENLANKDKLQRVLDEVVSLKSVLQ